MIFSLFYIKYRDVVKERFVAFQYNLYKPIHQSLELVEVPDLYVAVNVRNLYMLTSTKLSGNCNFFFICLANTYHVKN